MMTRRGFLGRIAAGVAAAAVAGTEFDLERALWVPGAKTIFLPEPVVAPTPAMIAAITAPNPSLFGGHVWTLTNLNGEYDFDHKWHLIGGRRCGKVLTQEQLEDAQVALFPGVPDSFFAQRLDIRRTEPGTYYGRRRG